MNSNTPMMIWDNGDWIFEWDGGRFVYVYEGTMTDSVNRAQSTPFSIIDTEGLFSDPTPETFRRLCEHWEAEV